MYRVIGKPTRFLARKVLAKTLEGEATEWFLEVLLFVMRVLFLISPNYRKNIKNFTGSYRFRDRAGNVNVMVSFHDGHMKVSEDPVPQTDVMVTFKSPTALRNFLLAFKKDILRVLLHNEILVTGNLNYLYKFIFMANHPLHPLLNLANELT
jgi:hypothetical protein